ncbi:MAG: toxin-antitoxin system [Acidobacteria bacterium]|nr:toxin-antitoxin system [Acidobacteriota bacterium]MBV9067333.1 toxin-antitoxin system [Acidobacteriota bacterium]MBV9186925.1 toxin-antitoxin system [Acidobacteriota bacterium]
MPELVIDEIEDDVLDKIQLRAYRNRRSTAAEAVEILRDTVKDDDIESVGLGTRLAARFHGIGIEEEIPELRGYPVKPIKL